MSPEFFKKKANVQGIILELFLIKISLGKVANILTISI